MLNYITCKFFNNENTLFIFKICFIFLFFFCNVFRFFLLQYFLIVFNTTSTIFECPSCISMLLILIHNSFIFSSFYDKLFNTTFFQCFFCNFYHHFTDTHTHKKKFLMSVFFFCFFIFYFYFFLSL